jgi:hypothetical protein
MIAIRKASISDVSLLSPLATQTIIESHGHSAPAEDMNAYIAEKYTEEIFRAELSDPQISIISFTTTIGLQAFPKLFLIALMKEANCKTSQSWTAFIFLKNSMIKN